MSTGPRIDFGDSGGGGGDEEEDRSTSGSSGSDDSGGTTVGGGGGGPQVQPPSGGGGDDDSTSEPSDTSDSSDSTDSGSSDPSPSGPSFERPDGEEVTQDEADQIREREQMQNRVRDRITEESAGELTGGDGRDTGPIWETQDGGANRDDAQPSGDPEPILRVLGGTPAWDEPNRPQANVDEETRSQLLNQYFEQAGGSPFGREDLVIREGDDGGFIIDPRREAVRREAAESFLDRLDGDFDMDDVEFGISDDDQLTVGLDRNAREQVRSEAQRDADSFAEGLADSDRDLFQEAAKSEADSFAEGIAMSNRDLFLEEAKLDAQAKLEGRLEERGLDPEDFEIEFRRTDEGIEARMEQRRAHSSGPIGDWVQDMTGQPADAYHDFTADVRGRLDDAADDLIEPRTPEAEAVADWVGGLSAGATNTGESIVEGLTEPRTPEAEAVADWVGDLGDSATGTGEQLTEPRTPEAEETADWAGDVGDSAVETAEGVQETADGLDVRGVTEPRTAEAEAAADWVGDVGDSAAQAGEDAFTAATILPRTGAVLVDRGADELDVDLGQQARTVGTAATIIPRAAVAGGAEISERDLDREALAGAAAVGVAAPEPVSSVGGLAVLGGLGLAAGAGYVANELDQSQSEITIPEEDRVVEIPIADQPGQQSDSELEPGDPTETASEIPVTGTAEFTGEVEVPTEPETTDLGVLDATAVVINRPTEDEEDVEPDGTSPVSEHDPFEPETPAQSDEEAVRRDESTPPIDPVDEDFIGQPEEGTPVGEGVDPSFNRGQGDLQRDFIPLSEATNLTTAELIALQEEGAQVEGDISIDEILRRRRRTQTPSLEQEADELDGSQWVTDSDVMDEGVSEEGQLQDTLSPEDLAQEPSAIESDAVEVGIGESGQGAGPQPTPAEIEQSQGLDQSPVEAGQQTGQQQSQQAAPASQASPQASEVVPEMATPVTEATWMATTPINANVEAQGYQPAEIQAFEYAPGTGTPRPPRRRPRLDLDFGSSGGDDSDPFSAFEGETVEFDPVSPGKLEAALSSDTGPLEADLDFDMGLDS